MALWTLQAGINNRGSIYAVDINDKFKLNHVSNQIN